MRKTLFWIAALLGVSTALQSPHNLAKRFNSQKKSAANPEIFKRASSNHGTKLHSNNKTARTYSAIAQHFKNSLGQRVPSI